MKLHLPSIAFGLMLGALACAVFFLVIDMESTGRDVPAGGDPDGYMMRYDEQGSGEAQAMSHMGMMAQMMVTSERDFIDMMVPHHEEAIMTAQAVLARGGTNERIRELMNAIIEAQTAEVASMKGWYSVWFGEPYTDTGEYRSMMRDLTGLSGTQIDRAFLEDMIPHHMGAIMMARSIQPYIEHEEMASLTAAIVRNQSAEIVLMRELLARLDVAEGS